MPLDLFERIAEERIQEAMGRGEFENLPGRGRPLRLELRDHEWGLAYHVLKQAGETLPWISLGREIEAAQARLESMLRDAPKIPPVRSAVVRVTPPTSRPRVASSSTSACTSRTGTPACWQTSRIILEYCARTSGQVLSLMSMDGNVKFTSGNTNPEPIFRR